jgi:tetratricopeptide (TPR) repeat protein
VVDLRGGEVPDPSRAASVSEFVDLLGRLRVWAGNPSLRTLAKRVGPWMRPPQVVAHTTVADTFRADRRRVSLDLVVAIVRALGMDEPVVAQWRAACIAVHSEARSSGPDGVFRQLPPETAVFTGRKRELEAVLKPAMTRSDPHTASVVAISAIDGMAGVGKTQLALHAAHELVRAGRFTDAQLYVDLRGFDPARPPADPAAVLDAFLRQLGVAAQRIPEALEERAAMFRDQMRDRDALILLDNAAGEDQIRDLIPASPTCLALVTSRRSLAGLDGAFQYTLDVFSPAESVRLLARIAGADRVKAEPEAAAAIVEACGFLPLAVALAASRLRARPAWTLAHLAHRLHTSGLDAFSVRNRALRPVLDLSYRGLPPSARFLFCVLGLHPGDDFSAAAAAAAGGISRAEADGILERLLDEHLLQGTTSGRYRFHDLIRGYAAELAHTELTPEQVRTASHRLVDWYLAGADEARRLLDPGRDHPLLDSPASPPPIRFADRDDALQWCDTETDNLRACTQFAIRTGHPDAAWRLPVVLLSYYQLRGRWDEADGTHHEALDHVRTRAPDVAVEVLLLRGLGSAASRRGRPELAEQLFQQVLELTDPEGLAIDRAYAFHNLSVIGYDNRRYADSVDNSRQALALFQSAADRFGQALSHSALAISTNALGDYPSALMHGQAAFDLAGAVASVMLQARAAMGMGETLYLMKDYHRALAKHEEALELNRCAGYLHGEASARYELGLTCYALQQRETAQEHLNHALSILRGLGAPEAALIEADLASKGMLALDAPPVASNDAPAPHGKEKHRG